MNTNGPVQRVVDHINQHMYEWKGENPVVVAMAIRDRLTAALAQQPEAPAQEAPYAWATSGGDVSRSWLWCNERCLPGQKPRPLVYGDTAPQPAIPEGWMMVPKEPTDVMIAAGAGEISYDENSDEDNARNAYLAMLAARPTKEPDHD